MTDAEGREGRTKRPRSVARACTLAEAALVYATEPEDRWQ